MEQNLDITDWTKVIEFDADNVMALCKRGILYAKIGQADQAIIDLERGLKNKNQLEESLRQESEILLEKLKPGK
jgi:regulator of sirC expression with transglutaminase-like and TPR domain